MSDNQDIVNNLQTVCDKETIWSKILAIGVAIAFIIGKVCYSLVHTMSCYKTQYFFNLRNKLLKVITSTLLTWYYKVRSREQFQKPSCPEDDKNK